MIEKGIRMKNTVLPKPMYYIIVNAIWNVWTCALVCTHSSLDICDNHDNIPMKFFNHIYIPPTLRYFLQPNQHLTNLTFQTFQARSKTCSTLTSWRPAAVSTTTPGRWPTLSPGMRVLSTSGREMS